MNPFRQLYDSLDLIDPDSRSRLFWCLADPIPDRGAYPDLGFHGRKLKKRTVVFSVF
jgi:hypothetical protein